MSEPTSKGIRRDEYRDLMALWDAAKRAEVVPEPRGTTPTLPETYPDWCAALAVTHAHCPYDCEHPQPFIARPGLLLCGRCWFLAKTATEMQPCSPAICEEP
jgi:hypothetical protein